MRDFQIHRICQITDAYCGPAVLQMLLGYQGIFASQDEIVEAGGATATIQIAGMRIDQLALAVHRLVPDLSLWHKAAATLQDITTLLTSFETPVGVEWQGAFDHPQHRDHAEAQGHYSIVSAVDPKQSQLSILDPYQDFITRDHRLGFAEFEARWWARNTATEGHPSWSPCEETNQSLFIVTACEAHFPPSLGLQHLAFSPLYPAALPGAGQMAAAVSREYQPASQTHNSRT